MSRKLLNKALFLGLICFAPSLVQAAETVTQSQGVAQVQTNNPALAASAQAAANWLKVIDQGNYDQSWDLGSLTMKLKIPKNDWKTILAATRGKLGAVKSRELVDQRTSKDPNGLPKGDYMVLIYKTNFTTKNSLGELVTMVLESDGKWRGLTYQVE